MITVETDSAIYSDIVGVTVEEENFIRLIRAALPSEKCPTLHFSDEATARKIYDRIKVQLLNESERKLESERLAATEKKPVQFMFSGNLKEIQEVPVPQVSPKPSVPPTPPMPPVQERIVSPEEINIPAQPRLPRERVRRTFSVSPEQSQPQTQTQNQNSTEKTEEEKK